MQVCVCVCQHDNSKYNESIILKLYHLIVYKNSSEKVDKGHCRSKVKITLQNLKSYISAYALEWKFN